MKLPENLLLPSPPDVRWSQGPFAHLVQLLPRTKGQRIEEIVRHIFPECTDRTSSDHDTMFNGLRTEIKGSFINKGSEENFSFLQIRPDQDYEQLLLATFSWGGIIQIFLIPKSCVESLIESRVFKKQHGGNKADSRTYCYCGKITPFNRFFVKEVLIENAL